MVDFFQAAVIGVEGGSWRVGCEVWGENLGGRAVGLL
jgi:hypothetical protein